MKKNMMGKALEDKMARGINLTILIGGPDDEAEEQKKLGLAPEGATEPNKDEDEKAVMLAHDAHTKNMMPGENMMTAGDPGLPKGQPPQEVDGKEGLVDKLLQNGLGKGSMAYKAKQAMIKKG